jgi:hypothetical protein
MASQAHLVGARAIHAFVACFTRILIANEEVVVETCRIDCLISAELSLALGARAVRGSSARLLSVWLIFLKVCTVSQADEITGNQRTALPTAWPAMVVARTSAKAVATIKNCKSLVSVYGSESDGIGRSARLHFNEGEI